MNETTCRMCHGASLLPAFVLPATPLANSYRRAPRVAPHDISELPLTVMTCQGCLHSQLREHVPGEVLFSEYLYTSGTSASFRKHFDDYALWLNRWMVDHKVQEGQPADVATVLEVGSNDGTFMKALLKQGFEVVGFEPARNLAKRCKEEGLTVIPSPFDLDSARWWTLQNAKPFDVIVGNNVFAHVESMAETMQAVSLMLRPGGLFVAEVQYLPKLFEMKAFDLVYHEHRDYHMLGEWESQLFSYGLQLVDAMLVPTHGGSLRFVAERRGGDRGHWPHSKECTELLIAEGYVRPMEEWRKLQRGVQKTRSDLHGALAGYNNIAVYGAPAKLTTLARTLGLDVDGAPFPQPPIRYVVDDAPSKQGLWMPNGLWPIMSRSALKGEVRVGPTAFPMPDCILIGAWNFKDDIVKALRASGVTCDIVVPFPEVEVLR